MRVLLQERGRDPFEVDPPVLRLAEPVQMLVLVGPELRLQPPGGRGERLEVPRPGAREVGARFREQLLTRIRADMPDHDLALRVRAVAVGDLQLGSDASVGQAGDFVANLDARAGGRRREKRIDMRQRHLKTGARTHPVGVRPPGLDTKGLAAEAAKDRVIVPLEWTGHDSHDCRRGAILDDGCA